MILYALTLQKATAITCAVYGNFSGPKQQEIIVARGKILELLRPDDQGKVQSICSVEVFSLIRALTPFRLTGGNHDYIIVGSDSGKITILEFDNGSNTFKKIHQETYGKTGCRRIVPGQYLGADPRGRAVMVGAVEKQKLVYILNRDSAANLTISSPLEAHKSHSICFDICGVDVGFDNPIFAALEVDYEEVENDPETNDVLYEKTVTFYELDLGLNHVVRKWSDPVDPTANLLIPVPGGNDGPGGVLVASENFLVYKNQGHPDRRCVLPRRKDLPTEHGLLLVSHAVHKQKDLFFILAQSEFGDVYKVTLNYEEEVVNEVVVRYLDTTPSCIALCILKTGFLFSASEFGNHALYQFQGIGDDEESPVATSAAFDAGDETVVEIEPRPLKNLLHVDDIENLSPITDCKVMDVAQEDSMQLYSLCGKSSRSSLRVLRHGLAVTEMAVSELPGNPNAVWTVRTTREEDYDKYIVVSFVNATLVLSIGETVEEVTDSGFLATSPTLAVTLLGDDALVQVHPGGIRHIRADKRINEWRTPGKRAIVKAACNSRQVVIALSGGEIIYFELDMMGQLLEVDKKDMGQDVSCVEIGKVPEGRQRNRFLAVGSWDNTMRILDLDPDNCMNQLSMQALPATAESIALVEMNVGATEASTTTFLNVGLQNGVLLRSIVDPINGQLSDTRTRFLGARPVKLFKTVLGSGNGVLALSSRSWAGYTFQQKFMLTPLSYETLEYASSFASEQCPEGIVAISGNTLRIVTVDRLSHIFNQEIVPLRYTPRRFALHPTSNHMVILETDHNAYNEAEKQELYEAAGVAPPVPAGAEPPEDEDQEMVTEAMVGVPRAGPGKWASCLRVYDPVSKQTLSTLELEENEAAFSLCVCQFRERAGEMLIVVGSAKDMTLQPRTMSTGYISVYALVNNNTSLQLVHKTPTEDVPYALAAFQGRLLAGVGPVLRLYDLGKKKMLRKCENKTLPTMVQSIHINGDRIVVGDMAEAFHFVRYKKTENTLYVFADDVAPRWLTASCQIDYNTMCGADKFGNVFITRMPAEMQEDVEDDPTGQKLRYDAVHTNGAPNKADEVIQYHVGEVVNSLQKVSLSPGTAEVILYTTIMGGIGALLPFASREDVDFFSHLEMHLRQENPPLCGREQVMFRSYYYPVKDVIDGDFLEQFSSIPPDVQRSIAEELDRTPGEVAKKLEEMRNRIL